jgi:hypothetical protein
MEVFFQKTLKQSDQLSHRIAARRCLQSPHLGRNMHHDGGSTALVCKPLATQNADAKASKISTRCSGRRAVFPRS